MEPLYGRRVVVAGGTGLVGRALVPALASAGAGVVLLERRPTGLVWPAGVQAWPWERAAEALEGAFGLVNLAGAGIADQRWTEARKALLWDSRILVTRSLVQTLAGLARRPEVLVNASAIGYYGARGEERLDEEAPAGSGFLPELCRAWEAEALQATASGMRVVCLRTGPVLAREGGALPRMALPVRWFLGAKAGSGSQVISWIHVQDLVHLLATVLGHPNARGPINATAPVPCSNRIFMQHLARTLHRPLWPVPAPATRLALKFAWGEMAEAMLLSGAHVMPRKALEMGFAFRFPQIEGALRDLFPAT